MPLCKNVFTLLFWREVQTSLLQILIRGTDLLMWKDFFLSYIVQSVSAILSFSYIPWQLSLSLHSRHSVVQLSPNIMTSSGNWRSVHNAWLWSVIWVHVLMCNSEKYSWHIAVCCPSLKSSSHATILTGGFRWRDIIMFNLVKSETLHN